MKGKWESFQQYPWGFLCNCHYSRGLALVAFTVVFKVLSLSSQWWAMNDSFESESEVAQSCPTLCDPMDCRLPGSSVHVIFQARILEWVAISFSRGSSWPRDQTQVSRIVGRPFTVWTIRVARMIPLLGFYSSDFWFSLVQFSHSVMSDSLWPHGLQHTRLSCSSPTPRVYSNSCPSSWWCHPTTSSSVIPFSSCL